jgi:hypothetical protein
MDDEVLFLVKLVRLGGHCRVSKQTLAFLVNHYQMMIGSRRCSLQYEAADKSSNSPNKRWWALGSAEWRKINCNLRRVCQFGSN